MAGNRVGSEPGRLFRHRILVESGAGGVANEAGRVHQDMAAAVVRPEAREASVVQRVRRHTLRRAAWRDPRRTVSYRQRRRRCHQQTLRL